MRESGRPETGPMKFGDDWRGLFVRGDHAFMYGQALSYTLQALRPLTDDLVGNPMLHVALARLDGLVMLLDASNEDEAADVAVQRLRPFGECRLDDAS